MHLVVSHGYQGADTDVEQLALSKPLFDAAFGESGVVAQPGLIVGDFNVEPTKIPWLAKGISAGLWDAAWAMARDSTGGHRRDFMVGCTLAAAAVFSAGLNLLGRILIVVDRPVRLPSLFSVLLFGLLPGCLLWTRVGVLSRPR